MSIVGIIGIDRIVSGGHSVLPHLTLEFVETLIILINMTYENVFSSAIALDSSSIFLLCRAPGYVLGVERAALLVLPQKPGQALCEILI